MMSELMNICPDCEVELEPDLDLRSRCRCEGRVWRAVCTKQNPPTMVVCGLRKLRARKVKRV